MATFDCAMSHNKKPSKTNNHNGRCISMFQKNQEKSSQYHMLNFDGLMKMTSA
jgi:hypothetical protein